MGNVPVSQWLEAYCQSAGTVSSALVALAAGPGSRLLAVWPRQRTPGAALQAAARAAIEQGRAFLHRGLEAEAGNVDPLVAMPVVDGGRTIGAVAVALRERGEAEQALALQQLQQAIEPLIPALAAPSDTGAADADQVLHLQATLLGQTRFEPTAGAFASELANLFHFDRVTVGFRERSEMRLVAVSHGAELKPRQDVYRLIAAAMVEAAHQATAVTFPPLPDARPQITLAHAELKNREGSAVCTIPLAIQGEVVGAVTLERNGSQPMRAAEIAKVEHAVCLAGPILDLARRAERGPLARVKELLQGNGRRASGSRPVGRLLACASVAAAVGVAGWMPLPYHVSAPARLEGAVQRNLVAPVDGFLEEVRVRPGDAIQAGQVLVELAQRDLLLERRKWESELTQHEHAYGAALARADRAQFVVNRAKAVEAAAQIALIEEHLARSRIVAPFDGIVMSGDLTQALGAPVKIGEALLSVAPADDYRLMVELDERDVREVAVGSRGEVLLAALPTERAPFEVVRTTPVAQTREGRHFFELEARLDRPIEGLRPGLAGVAKLKAEPRPLAAAMLHRISGWVRLTWWRWSG